MIKSLIVNWLHSKGWQKTLNQKPFLVQRELAAGKKNPLIFDVGAHHGESVKQYKAIFPDASIHSFEPVPSSFEKLKVTAAQYQQVNCHPFALGSVAGTATIHVNKFSATNSILKPEKDSTVRFGEIFETMSEEEIQIRTLDEFSRENSISNIEILKIDTQGFELDVLKGAARMLADQQIGQVFMEMLITPAYENQARMSDLLDFMDQHGYRLFNFFNLTPGNTQLNQVDGLFIPAKG